MLFVFCIRLVKTVIFITWRRQGVYEQTMDDDLHGKRSGRSEEQFGSFAFRLLNFKQSETEWDTACDQIMLRQMKHK